MHSAAGVFNYRAECFQRFTGQCLAHVHFILHRWKQPFFYFYRPCLALIRMDWHNHVLFHCCVRISVDHVGHRNKREEIEDEILPFAA